MAGIDSYTKLLLHANGVIGAISHPVTFNGDAKLSTAQKKFEASSLLLDGAGDYLTLPDSADWNLSTLDFTVDFWWRPSSSSTAPFVGQYDGVFATWRIVFDSNKIYVYIASALNYSIDFTPTLDTWYHIAVVREGNTWNTYVDGIAGSKTLNSGNYTASMPDLSSVLYIGAVIEDGAYLNGYLDELRISKALTRWSSNFTPSISQYTTDEYTTLLLHFDGNNNDTTTGDSVGGDEGYSIPANIVTFNGDVKLSHTTSKFGNSAYYFDGSGDYLTLPDSNDWNFESGDFTIECWVRFNTIQTGVFANHWGGDGYVDWLLKYEANKLVFNYSYDGSYAHISDAYFAWTPVVDTWYHVAIIRNGNDLKAFINGTQIGVTETINITFSNINYNLNIGRDDYSGGISYFAGYLDELRISKGLARWTSNFTPPTSEYSTYSQQTINSDTKIKGVGIQQTILSDSNITPPYQIILSDAKIKGENIQQAILSDAKISLPSTKINLGSTNQLIDTNFQRRIFKSSTGELIVFAKLDDGIKYKTSTDNGLTWSSWTMVYSTPEAFDITSDGDDVLLSIWAGVAGIKFIRLTYISPGWSIEPTIHVASSSQGAGIIIAKRNNGDLWIARPIYAAVYYNISSDGGLTWSSSSNISTGGVTAKCIQLIPLETEMWLFVVRSNDTVYLYKYDSSWYDTTLISSSSTTYHISVCKGDDNNIYAAITTHSGIRVYYYNGSTWDSGTLVTSDSYHYRPNISYIRYRPTVLYDAWSGAYKIGYTRFDGVSWSIPQLLTDYANQCGVGIIYDDLSLYYTYIDITGSPYYIMFDRLDFSNPNRETIESNSIVKAVGLTQTILSDSKIIIRPQETIESDAFIKALYNGKFIHNQDLYLVTDTIPSKLIKVDLNTLTYSKYTLSENSGKKWVINHTSEQLYASFANGYVDKIDINVPTTRLAIYVLEDTQLDTIVESNEYRICLVGNTIDAGDLFKIEETIATTFNTDFRYLKTATEQIKTFFSYIKTGLVNTDFRYLKVIQSLIKTDFRYLLTSFSAQLPLSRDKFVINIGSDNNVPDVDLSSITIRWLADSKSIASFDLARRHDKLNYTLANVYQEITNKNAVTIYFNGRLLFTGKIDTLNCQGENDRVTVNAKGDEWSKNTALVNLSLPSINEKLNLYHVLLDDIIIYNPYVDPNEENPEVYLGVKINLGKQETEKVNRAWSAVSMTQEEFDNFTPWNGWDYFWNADLKKYYFPNSTYAGNRMGNTYLNRYIGTSLGAFNSDIWALSHIYFFTQYMYENTVEELGYYYVGTAPYKEVNARNGKYVSWGGYWQDKSDGLYTVTNKHYDYTGYDRNFADIEYQKMLNINGSMLPLTSASIDLTLDALLFYNLALLTKINIVNTTESNIYNNNNGFPLSIKEVNISSQSMKVNLSVDNKKSIYELDELDKQLPTDEELDASPYTIEESSIRIKAKFDTNLLRNLNPGE